MTIRATIVLLAVPLFLGLALVNAALLYFQDGAEMRRALTEQALVTAVTIAEFVRVSDDPARRLTRADQAGAMRAALGPIVRSEEHTSELQSLMRISYAVFCLKKKKTHT